MKQFFISFDKMESRSMILNFSDTGDGRWSGILFALAAPVKIAVGVRGLDGYTFLERTRETLVGRCVGSYIRRRPDRPGQEQVGFHFSFENQILFFVRIFF